MNTCAQCQKSFEITSKDLAFYEQMAVPPPKQCPDCRLVRRFMERNPKNLYYRMCDFTKNYTLSQFHADQPFPVYSPESWWSVNWDALNYGQNFDFDRPFFDQFLELKNKTPHLALFNTGGTIQNSDFNNCTAYLKDCYLIAESDYCESSYYSNLLKNCQSVVDCSVCYKDELCYECVDCTNCYTLLYSQDCQTCKDSYFLQNCISCSDCIGCINQRQQQYMIFNKKYSRDEYEKFKEQFALHTKEGVAKLNKICTEFFLTEPRKNLIAEHNENSSGDHLFNSKNAHHCFDSIDLEDCSYCAKLTLGVKSSMDYNSWGNKCELMYQCSSCGDHCYNLKFCANSQSDMNNCEYCAECFGCSDCFGCVNLKKEKFCIFNKKYSEAEYHELKTRIIEHMKQTGEYGEFFPIEICPYGYNETMAMDSFPLCKEEATKKGFKWYDPPEQKITDTTDNIATCPCSKNFKIISQETAFYKKLGIPQPEKCPTCRHENRMKKRQPLKLWDRECAKCNAAVKSNYKPDCPEIIYCEECYLKEVY